MNQEYVITEFCKLSREVMGQVFKFSEPADCFCDGPAIPTFQFSPRVFEFIQTAVREKIAREKDTL